jgi:hypothetical protein
MAAKMAHAGSVDEGLSGLARLDRVRWHQAIRDGNRIACPDQTQEAPQHPRPHVGEGAGAIP